MALPPTTPGQIRDSELDYLVSSLRKEPDELIKERLQRMVYEGVSHPLRFSWEREASLNYQYIENDFYTDDELAEYEERGQPPTRRNEIAPILERIAGQFIMTRQQATFLGRNTPADDQAGFIAQDYVRWLDQQNMYEFEEQEQIWDGMAGGVGWIKSYIKTNELGQAVQCDRAVNAFHIWKDPYSQRYDPNEDAKYMLEGRWMDVEDAIALWPDAEESLRTMIAGPYGNQAWVMSQVAASLQNEAFASAIYNNPVFVDRGRKRIRPFEVWYKRKVQTYYLFRPDGVVAVPVPMDHKTAKQIVTQLGEQIVAKPIFQDRMYMGVILGDLVIHHDVSPHRTNRFPYTPFYSGMRKNGNPLPLASRLVPINEAINKRESKALALLTNRRIVAEKNAIDDPEEAQIENANPDAYVEVREGAISGNKVLFTDNLDLGNGQMALLQEDKDAMRRVSGHGNESMGMPSEVRSGSGIARKQMMSNLIVMPMNNNLRRSRYLRAKLTFEYMKQYVTEEMSFQITDDPNVPKLVQVTKSHIAALKERIYDVVITETKDYAVLREQQAEMFLTVLPQLAALGPGMVKLGIQLTEFREKEALMKMVDQQSAPPPVVPKFNITGNWSDFTPEMQAFIAMVALQSPELAQAIMQKGDDPAFLQKLKADLAKTQVKEGTRATLERGKLDMAALQTAMEGRLEMRRIMNDEDHAGQDMMMNGQPQEGDMMS